MTLGIFFEANVVDPNVLELKNQELQIMEKALVSKSKNKSERASEALKEEISKKTIALAKAKQNSCEINDEYEALNKKTPIEFISDLSNYEIT